MNFSISPWIYILIEGLPSKKAEPGLSVWLISFAGLLAMLCYLGNRHYSSALYNAKFIKALMEDSDEEMDQED